MRALIRRHEAAMRLIQRDHYDEHTRWQLLALVLTGQPS